MLRSWVALSGALGVVACGSDDTQDDGAGRGGTSPAGASGSAQSGSSSSGGGSGGANGGAPTGGRAGGAGAGGAGTAGGEGGVGPAGGSAGNAGAGEAGGQPGGAGGSAAGTAGSTSGSAGGGAAGAPFADDPVVYLGGYSQNGSTYPFMLYDLDRQTGSLTARGDAVNAGVSPTYITVAPSRRFLYVANEADDASGGLTALAIGADGSLTRLNHQTGSDGGLVHVAVTPDGRFALGASYNGGSVSVFPIMSDGSLGAQVGSRDFGMQAQSHCIGFDPSGQHVLVPNKGNDEVAQLLLADDGMLTPNTPAQVASDDGAGPRHIAVHPNGRLAFVINELDSTMTPYALAESGTLTPGTSVSTLPAGFNGQNSGAHVELSPDGHFVYGSNRGHDSIVVFAADQSTGALTLVEHETAEFDTPRDFDMDPAGQFLLVAFQGSDRLSVYRIGSDGGLSLAPSPLATAPDPAAVQIVYLP